MLRILALLLLATPAAAQSLTGRAAIHDGDSIKVNGVHIRMLGYDSPELKQRCRDIRGDEYPCGVMATIALTRIIADQPVTCVPEIQRNGSALDIHGRTLAACSVAGDDIGRQMVASGWALSFMSHRYDAAETEARRNQRGLHGGTFQSPSEFRKQAKGQR